jgi:DNA-directed RNA polymerase subunit RPC12/RpoP
MSTTVLKIKIETFYKYLFCVECKSEMVYINEIENKHYEYRCPTCKFVAYEPIRYPALCYEQIPQAIKQEEEKLLETK